MTNDFRDSAYDSAHYALSELPHEYGEGVHILGDPFALSQLARLCSPDTHQPAINRLIHQLYQHLAVAVINKELPRARRSAATRMHGATSRAILQGEWLDTATRVVTVDIARAGILPSQVCYDLLNTVLPPENVRQDHLIVSRVTDDVDRVTGAEISGRKIGGPIDDRFVLFPDPMGATGTSLVAAMEHYKSHHGDSPARLVTLNLIITPQFVRAIKDAHPEVRIYALRLDRGMSDPAVLAEGLGARWDEESGLNENDYIVPGGGGFGEIMNNSYV